MVPLPTGSIHDIFTCIYHVSGQMIATSHEFSPQKVAKEGKWDPSFQGNLGW